MNEAVFKKELLNILNSINDNLLHLNIMLALQHTDPEVKKAGKKRKSILVPHPFNQAHSPSSTDQAPLIGPQRGEDEN